MAIIDQFCSKCFQTIYHDDRKGTVRRGTCKACKIQLSTFSELPVAARFLSTWLAHGIAGIDLVQEHRFDDTRRRLDFAWPAFKVAVEIDGYGFGHLMPAKIAKDHEKVNDAAVLGWTVLRYVTSASFTKSGVLHAVDQVSAILETKIATIEAAKGEK
jgi:very-short-patch-repair endonuclease